MRCLAIILWLCCLASLRAAEADVERDTTVPEIGSELKEAPWYDGSADSWRRVVPRERRSAESEDAFEGVSFFAFAMYALIIAALALLAALIWKLRMPPVDLVEERRKARIEAGVSSLPFDLPAAAGDPEAAFRAACAAGNWNRAVIWLYAWQLTRLDARGRLRLAAGKTNRMYVGEVASDPTIGRALAATVAAFEASYFGRQVIERGTVDQLQDLHRNLLSASEAGPTS